jgi:PAS domain S-box-containing protein
MSPDPCSSISDKPCRFQGESKTIYEVLIDTAPDAITVIRDQQFLYANDAAIHMFGTPTFGDLSTHAVPDLISPQDRAAMESLIQQANEGSLPGWRDITINRHNNSNFNVSARVAPLEYAGGPAVMIIFRNFTGRNNEQILQETDAGRGREDITNLEKAELQLRETREQNKLLASIIEQASLPFSIGNPDGSFGLMNRAFEDLVGYTRDELATLTWSQALTPPEWQQFERSILKNLDISGKPAKYEKEYIRKNGTRVPVELLTSVVRDTKGNPLFYFAFITDLTERKKIQSNLVFQAILLNNISDAVISLDTGFRITSWNPAAETMYGWTPGEALGKPSVEVLKSDSSKEEDLAGWDRLQDGKIVRTELIHHRKDGTAFWVDSVSQALHDHGGRVIGYLSVNRNITHRKGIEVALKESEEKFRIIATNTPDHILMQDRDLRYTLVINPQIGLSEKEMLGKTDHDFLLPDDAETITKIKKNVMESRNAAHSNLALRNRSGETEYFEGTYVPKTDLEGNVNGIIGYFSNVTLRHRMESDLMNALSLINASLESTADGLLVMDNAGKITSYNRNFQEMWKIPGPVMESRNEIQLLEYLLMQVQDPDNFLEQFFELDRHPDRESYDMVELVNGRIFERFSKPQKIENSTVGRVWSFRDVTDRKRSEQRIIDSLNEKEVLLREIHHRVKNNLQLVSGLLDMTRMRTNDPVTQTILTDMMLKIQTMAQIHTRLYESREFGKINIKEQILDQVSSLSSVYSPKGHDITCEINSGEIVIPVDQAIPCALVVNEILSNAYKHAFSGRQQGVISVKAEQVNDRVRIEIRDDGIGLPEGFDPNMTTSLGVKLIRTLMRQQLRGLFEIRSHNGTEVVVEFPVQKTEA